MAIQSHLVKASKSVEEGGTGKAAAFWDWNEEQVKRYS